MLSSVEKCNFKITYDTFFLCLPYWEKGQNFNFVGHFPFCLWKIFIYLLGVYQILTIPVEDSFITLLREDECISLTWNSLWEKRFSSHTRVYMLWPKNRVTRYNISSVLKCRTNRSTRQTRSLCAAAPRAGRLCVWCRTGAGEQAMCSSVCW